MLKRPWHTWAAFALCLAVVLGAMGWISATVLRLDEMEQRSKSQAEREENVRLALWRMDSALAPLIAQESARPYFAYGSFYPAERAYTRMFNTIQNGDVLVPSPLLTQTHPHTLLHFQIGPDGKLTSPQVPNNDRLLLAQAHCAPPERLNESGERLKELKSRLEPIGLLELLPPLNDVPQQVAMLSDEQVAQIAQQEFEIANKEENDQQQQKEVNVGKEQQARAFMKQASRNSQELAKRKQVYQEASQNNWTGNMLNKKVDGQPDVQEGIFQPVWQNNMLLLVRRVSVARQSYLQGCWLDWPGIKRWLTGSVNDLLPNAALDPVMNQNDRPTLQLAALPLRLTPGIVPLEQLPALTPLRMSLLVAWVCVLLAAGAVAALLMGALSLSERRGAFVSAVTHELRTPLTTFRMYTEMLSDGMVKDEAKRTHYLHTMRAEAVRLSHLVENVLAYARLEGGSAANRAENVCWPQFVAKVQDRLSERAAQAEMELVVRNAGDDVHFHADSSAVEQVMFNLVDNACKYASLNAGVRRIEIDACNGGASTVIRVRDFGPGVSSDMKQRLFQPFSKSAQQAAHSAPGVGLGLALCRRLARDMGGDLRLDPDVSDGACFELTLPAA